MSCPFGNDPLRPFGVRPCACLISWPRESSFSSARQRPQPRRSTHSSSRRRKSGSASAKRSAEPSQTERCARPCRPFDVRWPGCAQRQFFIAGSLYGSCRRSSSARTSCWRSKRTQTGAMSEGELRFRVMYGAYALGTEGSAGWNIGWAAGHAPCARILTPHRDVRIRAGGCAGVCAYTHAH